MKNKILLGLGTIAFVASTGVAISCSSNPDTNNMTVNLKSSGNLLSTKLFKKPDSDDINKEDFSDTLISKNDSIIKKAVDDTNDIVKSGSGKIMVIIQYNDADIEVDIQIKTEKTKPIVNVNKVYLTKNGGNKEEDNSSKTKISAFKKYTKKFVLALIEVGKDPNVAKDGIAAKVNSDINTP